MSFLFGRGESNILFGHQSSSKLHVAFGIWHLYRLVAIQLRNDAIEEKEAMLLE